MFTDFQRRPPRFAIPTNPVSSVCHKAIHLSLRGPISLSPPPSYRHSAPQHVKAEMAAFMKCALSVLEAVLLPAHATPPPPPIVYWNHSSNIAVKHCRWKLRAGVPVGFVSRTLPPHYRSDVGVRPKTRSPRRSTSSTPLCCSKRSAGALRLLCSFGSRSRETVYQAHLGVGFSLSQLRGFGFRAARSHLGFLPPPLTKQPQLHSGGSGG